MKLMFIMIKIGVPAVMAVCLSCCSGHTAGGGNELKCRVMEVEGGYGYVVLHGADTLIYQPFIPALSGRLPFATKVEALAAGRLVCRKLADGTLDSNLLKNPLLRDVFPSSHKGISA